MMTFLDKKITTIGFLCSFLFLSILSGCELHEGEGGMGSIKGKVYALNYDGDFQTLEAAYYAPEENVYIVYGDDEIYSDRMDTHYDGSFRFDFLYKGTYTIYAYSKDSTGQIPAGEFPVIREIEITDKKQVVDLGDLVILK